MNYFSRDKTLRGLSVLTILLVGLLLFVYESDSEYLLGWVIESTARTENFVYHQFSKGPFSFDLEGQQYIISDTFSGTALEHIPYLSELGVYAIWIGICLLLTVTTYWKRYWFLATCALIFVMINLIDPDSWEILGSRPGNKWLALLMMIFTLGPAYYMHAYRPTWELLKKWSAIATPSTLILVVFHSQTPVFVESFLANSHISLSILAILFVFLVAEEILFLILYIITKSKGNGNDKHIIIFGFVYLLYLGLYYAKKASLVRIELFLFDPFYLLAISCLIAIWSFRFKQEQYALPSAYSVDIRYLLVSVTIPSLIFIATGMLRGNNPAYEAMHHVVLYAHLGFGLFFMIYILVNFYTPLVQGLAVFRVAFKNQNFPYISARLAGLVAVVAFFLLSDNEIQKQIQGARLNYLGDVQLELGEINIANEYYRQGSVFAWDNHYSNYRLGDYYFKKGDFNESTYRFNQATKKYPSPQAYVNLGNSYLALLDDAKTPGVLREGLIDFPDNAEIQNNLALELQKNGNNKEAINLLRSPAKTDKWNQALLVNKWSLSSDSLNYLNHYRQDYPSLKTNVLSKLNLENSGGFQPDHQSFSRKPNMHRTTLMINSLWHLSDSISDSSVYRYRTEVLDATLNNNLRHAYAGHLYKAGRVDESFRIMDDLQGNAYPSEQGFYLNQMGLWALEQNAAIAAESYFRRAQKVNIADSQFNLIVALLEGRKWQEAQIELESFVSRDSSYFELANFLYPIIAGNNNQSFAYWYYRFFDESPGDLAEMIARFNEKENSMLWDKVSAYCLKKGDYDLLEVYFEVLKPHLASQIVTEFQAFLNQGYQNFPFPSNSFDLLPLLTYVRSDSILEEVKYDLLVHAMEFNQSSPEVLKLYCLSAMEMGLNFYAQPVLEKLKTLIPPREFSNFEADYEAALRRKRENVDWSF